MVRIFKKFEIRNNRTLQIRKESINFFSGNASFRLVYISDLHLTGARDHALIMDIIKKVNLLSPDLILLGGDLVDFSAGMPELEHLCEELVKCCLVCSVSGNHDKIFGENKIIQLTETKGVKWLNNASHMINLPGNYTIVIDGFPDHNKTRETNTKRILCTHNPAIFPKAINYKYDLVLAGHLHGGQFVLWKGNNKFYPAALLFKWCGRIFRSESTTMIVSKGVSDLFPVRYNCPREIIVCEIS